MRNTQIVGSIALFIALGGPATAAEPRPLPTLALVDMAGAPVGPAGLPGGGTWLLVYVRTACRPCDTLLDQMNRDERPDAERIVIVVRATPEAAQAIKARYPNLNRARWLLDENGAGAATLALPTVPAAVGVRDGMIQWTLAGTLRGGPELESVLFSWLGRK